MWSNEKTDLYGHDSRSIYNRLYTHTEPTSHLTVVIAGFAYTIESPYLFYSKHVPYMHGNDILAIDFEYSRNRAFLELSDQEKDAWFHTEVSAIANYLQQQKRYRHLSFIGKSLGTTAVFQLLQDEDLRMRTTSAVWITPGEKRSEIARLMLNDTLRSMVVYGAEDRYAKDAPVTQLRNRPNVDVLVIPGADHALETGDLKTSIKYLSQYLDHLNDLFGIDRNAEA
ncbi:MAG: hypothetical protein KAU31_14365 [Spirochaetaceae bacterium]|nr:hypothetical protein [Spirochaetaceae bacterium]